MRIHTKKWMKLLEKTRTRVEVFIDKVGASLWFKVKEFNPVIWLKIPSCAGMKHSLPKAFLEYSYEKASFIFE